MNIEREITVSGRGIDLIAGYCQVNYLQLKKW